MTTTGHSHSSGAVSRSNSIVPGIPLPAHHSDDMDELAPLSPTFTTSLRAARKPVVAPNQVKGRFEPGGDS